MAVTSPFAAQEKAAGAVFCERFGVDLPEHFGDPAVEYEAVRKRVGLVDLSIRYGWMSIEIEPKLSVAPLTATSSPMTW